MGFFGSKVTDWAIDELKACFNGVSSDILDLRIVVVASFDMLVSAELKINLVGIIDELLDFIGADKVWEFSADGIA